MKFLIRKNVLIKNLVFTPVFVLLLSQLLATAKANIVDTRKLFKDGSSATSFDASIDSLCFSNHGFKSSMGKNPFGRMLGAIADKKGACQGMVGLAAAVKLKIEFRPHEKQMSKKTINKKLKKAIRLHQNNCGGKVIINGYQNLKSLCFEHEDILKKRSVFYNLALARKEILRYGPTFFIKPILENPVRKTRHLLKHLKSMYQDLKKGRFPLMLVRNHVTLVTNFQVKRNSDGYITKVILSHYDPNRILTSNGDLRKRVFIFSKDGSEIKGRYLIWNITPRPLTKFYCPFIKKDIE